MNSDLLRRIADKVVVFDGAMGTALQERDLSIDDFGGHEGLNEILVETRPDVVRDVHASYLAAGCDAVETNTFGANAIVLAEYGLAHRAYEVSRQAAALARGVADDFAAPDTPRFVIGSIGPGTKLPSVGHIGFRDLRDAFVPQAEGLVDGGADALLLETCQDLLQVKAALDAVSLAFRSRGKRLPIFVSITVEATGTMLVGSDIDTAAAALLPMGIDALGLNCATGPDQMKRRVQALAAVGPPIITAMPNAGLPKNVGGRTVYPMEPAPFAGWVEGFVREDGANVVGGCCGTTPAHLKLIVDRVGGLAAPQRSTTRRAELASLYTAVPMVQVPAPLIVGERMNSNGSKAFRERLLAGDVDGMLAVGRDQERGGAHVLDVCVAYVGRDERADMDRLLQRLAPSARLPLMIDSTDPDVIEAALERIGGRAIINSINLEDGRDRLDEIVALAKRFGAALVALVIDEEGMARTVDRKVEVAERIHRIVVDEHGMRPEDLVFDMLTFTVASGDPESRTTARDTLDAITAVKERLPGVHTILGVSNVSFGLKPAARRLLNSVFLSMAVERGLDQAIVNARGIIPLMRIEPELQDICRRLILADWTEGDPLAQLLERYADATSARRKASRDDSRPLAERLRDRVIDGEVKGLDSLLDALIAEGRAPVSLINEELVPAMRVVGELFGSGQMQLPFVLQSAETMKTAVRHLEPLMKGERAAERGTMVLATVKGDVHDIGKNLVDIILSNNGFRVVNLGIKVPVEEILRAAEEHRADAIGMSGLLVKSTVVMKDNLEEMARRGLSTPVVLGGAALNRAYVEDDLRAVYGDGVFYAADAFAGLETMRQVCGDAPTPARPKPARRPQAQPQALSRSGEDLPAPEVDRSVLVPTPPFLGARVVEDIPLDEVFGLLNETTLFRGQWRYRRGKLSREAYDELIEGEVRPLFEALKREIARDGLLRPRAVIGYFPCHSEGRDVVICDPETGSERVRLSFPRRASAPHHCVADYFRPKSAEPGALAAPDVIGMFVATVGERVQHKIRELFESDAYRDYLHLHGLATESAEATAEWTHRQMRRALGIEGADVAGEQAMVRQAYRGSRYSFGYPACPDLASQIPLFELLEPARIGVSLTDGYQMVPEHSVSAIVVHHPQAKYFTTT